MVTTIYAMRDPDGSIRYIGRTRSPLKSRLIGHVSEARWNRSPRSMWIRALRFRGMQPTIGAIETVTGDHAKACEREEHWIRHYRAAGADLLNLGHTRGNAVGRSRKR